MRHKKFGKRVKGYKPKGTKKEDVNQDKQIQKLTKKVRALEEMPEVKVATESSNSLIPGLLVDVGAANWAFPTTPSPRQGTTQRQRIGNKITLKKWRVDLKCVPSANVLGTTVIRVIFGIDKEQAGAIPFVFTNFSAGGLNSNLALLDNLIVTTGGGYPDLTQVPLNQNTRNRFKILKDKVYTIHPSGSIFESTVSGANVNTDTVIPTVWHKTFYIDYNNMVQNYQVDGGTQADLVGKTPFMMIVTDQQAIGDYPGMSVFGCMYYTDV